jgi:hypothetical protein
VKYSKMVDQRVAFARRYRTSWDSGAAVVHVTGDGDAFIRVGGAGWVPVGKWDEYKALPPPDRARLLRDRFRDSDVVGTQDLH